MVPCGEVLMLPEFDCEAKAMVTDIETSKGTISYAFFVPNLIITVFS